MRGDLRELKLASNLTTLGMGLNDIWWAWGSGRSPLFWDERKSNLIIETGKFQLHHYLACLLILSFSHHLLLQVVGSEKDVQWRTWAK